MNNKVFGYKKITVLLSLLLMFMVIPHVLEDFAFGEPEKNNVPMLILQLVVAGLIAFQTLGLYTLGSNNPLGYYIQMIVGIIWPVLAGVAQLPAILSNIPYRSGFISVIFVIGIMVIGFTLSLSSLVSLRVVSKFNNEQK